MLADSLFTNLLHGDLPAPNVHEPAQVLVFMDIHPIQPGQVLVIPKAQVGFIWDLIPEDYQALMSIVQKVGQRIREVFPDKARVGVMIEGLDVTDHCHVKVFPFSNEDEYRNVPDASQEPDHSALAAIAQKLAF